MKRIYAFLVSVIYGCSVFAQSSIVLNYDSHAIKYESNNEMKICHFISPGDGGENKTWNFSNLQEINNFTGTIISAYQSINSSQFPEANTDLEEFNNHFYFKVDENAVGQYGYASANNSIIMKLEKPFIKMIFPLTYGGRNTGTFNGTITINSVSGTIDGTYEVFADGYGKLKLPGNYEVENTLRVKSVKDYDQVINGATNHFTIITYRWYASWYRYPLLVLTETKSGSSSISYQAAYNNQVSIPLKLDDTKTVLNNLFDVYPNPLRDNLGLNYSVNSKTKVRIEVYNISGKKVKTLIDKEMEAGNYHEDFNTAEIGLTKGTYILKAEIAGDRTQTKEIVITD